MIPNMNTSSTSCLLVLVLTIPHTSAFHFHPIPSLCSQPRPSRTVKPQSLQILHSENHPKDSEIIQDDSDLFAQVQQRQSAPPTAEEEETPYESSIDWDAEWKKVSENKNPRPRDKTALEARATRATNRVKRAVAKNVYEAKEEMRRQVDGVGDNLPTFSMLQGDWRVGY